MKKLTKSMVCLAALLVVSASTMGCVDKATGGGWFYDYDTGNKCTFGFNAQYKDNPGAVETGKIFTGQFQFKDHETGVKFHLEEMISVEPDDGSPGAGFEGYDKDGKFVIVCVDDGGEPGWGEGDAIAIWREPDEPDGDPTWCGYIEGGNIVAHQYPED